MKISLENAEHYRWGDNCDGWHLLKTSSLSVIQERMPVATRESFHFHHKSQQLFYILSGVAKFMVADEKHIVAAGESIHIPSGKIHAISNESSEMLEFIVISEPMAHGDRTDINTLKQ